MRYFSRLICILLLFICPGTNATAQVIYPKNYGAIGDGVTDDGPAILKAITKMLSITGKKKIVFDSSKQYYIKQIDKRYLFDLMNVSDIEIDGRGSVFLLDKDVNFASIFSSKSIKVKNLSIDFLPLPFADGLVISKNKQAKTVDVKIYNGFQIPPFKGPSNKPEEQTYFGMLWNQGPYTLLSTHFYIDDIYNVPSVNINSRVIRIKATDLFNDWEDIIPNETQISVPVSGIAHIGGYEVVRVIESENVDMVNVDIWSAPWFAIGITRNKGKLCFTNVNVRPKPGTGRLTSSWRDGFHVNGNYSSLLFENCEVKSTNDDAFNICSFASSLTKKISDSSFVIKQNYPLEIVPYNIGDRVMIFDVENGQLLDSARVKRSYGFIQTGKPIAPEITIELDRMVKGIGVGFQIWNLSSANPNTIMKNCTITNSCRFQTSIVIDSCDIRALSWFYGDNLEGPLPERILIKNSNLFRGRGNPTSSLVIGSNVTRNGKHIVPVKPVISEVILENNKIDGEVTISSSHQVTLINNKVLSPQSAIRLDGVNNIDFKSNPNEAVEIKFPKF